MRFLCLAGLGTNAETLRLQITPIVRDLEQDGTASFHFIHGTVPAPPPKGFEELFGPPPHLRFLDAAYVGMTDEEIRNLIWDTPRHFTPEQKFQHLRLSIKGKGNDGIRHVLDRIYGIVDEEGPFDGILGLSEGAGIAATFLIDNMQKAARNERKVDLKCAIFMSAGCAPFTSDSQDVYLADEYGQIITIPTCHIFGWNDNMLDSAIALYHLCDEDSATIVDHGKGHGVPQDADSSRIMIKGIRDLIACC